MAGEEKKKPDLKSRLKRTEVGQTASVGPRPPESGPGPGFGPGFDPGTAQGLRVGPLSSVPPRPLDSFGPDGDFQGVTPALPMDFGAPLVPGLGDIAPPEFIRQQQQARAEAEARGVAEAQARAVAQARASALAAAAADPFGASSAQSSPQEVRLVIDEKSVSDAEVGRKNTGQIVGILATGVVMLGAGYLMGGFVEQRSQAKVTMTALTDIRRAVDEAGASITMLKDKVDRAATSAGIATAPGEPSAPRTEPSANARLDLDLGVWFEAQHPEPPLTAEVYANRVGRLRPDLVTKLMTVQIKLERVWLDLRRHSERTRRDSALITAALHDGQTARADLNRMVVVFSHGPNNGPPIVGALVGYPGFTAASALGPYAITPALPGGVATRTLYQSGDLSLATVLGTLAVPVSATVGTPALAVRGIGQPWTDYVTRLRAVKTLIDELVSDHHSLAEVLSH